MTPKFKAKLKASINKLRRQWPAIVAVKKKARVGPELYKCSGCGMLVYSGKRSIESIRINFPTAIEGKIEIDHVIAVQPVDGKELTWDEYIDRVFCDESNLMALCKNGCHQIKSLAENEERRQNRKAIKKNEL